MKTLYSFKIYKGFYSKMLPIHPPPSTISLSFQEATDIASLRDSLYSDEQDWPFMVLNFEVIWPENLKPPLLTQTGPLWNTHHLLEV